MSDKVSHPSSCPLEQFVLLGKTAKSAAAVGLIKQVLAAPGVYVFGELLDLPNIQDLKVGEHSGYYELLNLFAFGTYKDWKQNQANLPELTPVQLQKLRHLTIVSLATKSKVIPYSVLLEELDISNLRTLEDLIIESIYTDIISGKLDQSERQLEVDYAIGRDIRTEDINTIIGTLSDWVNSCQHTLTGIEEQINQANVAKDKSLKHKANIEQEISNIRKTLKSQSGEAESEEMTIQMDSGRAAGAKSKTGGKMKGIRGNAKFWPKHNN